jgi:hypothetical protein
VIVHVESQDDVREHLEAPLPGGLGRLLLRLRAGPCGA